MDVLRPAQGGFPHLRSGARGAAGAGRHLCLSRCAVPRRRNARPVRLGGQGLAAAVGQDRRRTRSPTDRTRPRLAGRASHRTPAGAAPARTRPRGRARANPRSETAPADLPIDASRPLLVFLHGTEPARGQFRRSVGKPQPRAAPGHGRLLWRQHLRPRTPDAVAEADPQRARPGARATAQRAAASADPLGAAVWSASCCAPGRLDAAPFDETDLAIVGPADAALLGEPARGSAGEAAPRRASFVRVACPARGTSSPRGDSTATCRSSSMC